MDNAARQRWRQRDAEAVWNLLKSRRTELNLTQEEAAFQCGVKKQTFSDWERCISRPAGKHRSSLAVFLGMNSTDLEIEIGTIFPYNND